MREGNGEKLSYYDFGCTPFFALQSEPRVSYCLYVPADYDEAGSKTYTLVVMMHGTERSAWWYRDEFAAFADDAVLADHAAGPDVRIGFDDRARADAHERADAGAGVHARAAGDNGAGMDARGHFGAGLEQCGDFRERDVGIAGDQAGHGAIRRVLFAQDHGAGARIGQMLAIEPVRQEGDLPRRCPVEGADTLDIAAFRTLQCESEAPGQFR